MPSLDYRTVSFMPAALALLYLPLLWILHTIARKSMRGTGDWLIGMTMLLPGLYLFTMQGKLDAWLSVDLENFLLFSGQILVCRGYYLFSEKRFPFRVYTPLIIFSMCVTMFFQHVIKNDAVRIFTATSVSLITLLDICRLIIYNPFLKNKMVVVFASLCYVLQSVNSIGRIVSVIPKLATGDVNESLSTSTLFYWIITSAVVTWAVINFAVLISERLQARLSENVDELNQMIQTRERFYGMLAHDINGPLKAMVNIFDAIKERGYTFPENSAGAMAMIHKSANNIYDLLRNLLLWSQIQGYGRRSLQKQRIPVQQAVAGCLELNQFLIYEKKIQLEMNLPPNQYFESDPNIVSFVLRNLITNAVRFSTVKGTINISAVIDSGRIVFSVHNQGTAMSADAIDRLMQGENIQPTADDSGTRSTGLGIRMCVELLQMAGSSLKIQSSPDEGTLASFALPGLQT